MNFKTVDVSEIKHYPLAITYLQTIGNEAEYTTNFVSYDINRNPNLIIMNDFVIQFYESPELIKFFNFYGLTTEQNYEKLINFNEEQFVVNIFQNERRKKFLHEFRTESAKQTIQNYADRFRELWFKCSGVYPPNQTTQKYLKELTSGDEFNVHKYTKENVFKITVKFVKENLTNDKKRF